MNITGEAMKRADEQTLKAFNSLQRATGYYRVLEHLKESYDSTIAGLISAKQDRVQNLQGTAQTLKELIALLEHN